MANGQRDAAVQCNNVSGVPWIFLQFSFRIAERNRYFLRKLVSCQRTLVSEDLRLNNTFGPKKLLEAKDSICIFQRAWRIIEIFLDTPWQRRLVSGTPFLTFKCKKLVRKRLHLEKIPTAITSTKICSQSVLLSVGNGLQLGETPWNFLSYDLPSLVGHLKARFSQNLCTGNRICRRSQGIWFVVIA